MKVATAFLTTYERPEVLAQSLRPIVEQCRRIDLPLLILDDGSRDPRVHEMLDGAAGVYGGVRILRLGTADGLHMHLSTGRAFLRGLASIGRRYERDSAFLKLDDDIVLTDDAIPRLVEAWGALCEAVPPRGPGALSAMLETHKEPLGEFLPGVVQTVNSCSVACVHRIDLMTECIADYSERNFLIRGWDCAFAEWLEHKLMLPCFTLTPSRAFHVGHLGVHGRDLTGLNRRPPDIHAFPGAWALDDAGAPVRPASVRVEVAPEDLDHARRTYASRVDWPAAYKTD